MGFTPFVVQSRAQAAQGTGFSVTLKKQRQAPAKLVFTLRPNVAAELGWPDKSAIAVLIGDGEQRGLIRLKAEKGGSAILLRRGAGGGGRGGEYFSLGLGHVPAFPDRSEEKRWVNYEQLEDGWVEVVLPKWADPSRSPAAPVRNAAVALAVGRQAGGSVVSSLMGDPPRGRSALEQGAGKEPTRGEARRVAEAREAPQHVVAEQVSQERQVVEADRLGKAMLAFGLTKTEGRYLTVLLEGRLATKERLLESCHDEGEHLEGKSVDVYVHKLRAKLSGHLVLIDTVRNQGYLMQSEAIARANRLIAAAAEPVMGAAE